jgi:hypothetical protein
LEFNTKVFDGVYINIAEGTYTFKDLIVYIRGNIHRWKDSPLVWDLTQFPLAEDAEPSAMIEEQLSGAKDLAEMRSLSLSLLS